MNLTHVSPPVYVEAPQYEQPQTSGRPRERRLGLTGLIDKLERDGLVRRVPDPSDRRSVRAQLTKAGVTRIEDMRKDASEWEAKGAAALKPRQLTELRHLCLLMANHLDILEGGN